MDDCAVYIRSACKSYGSKRILQNLNMKVHKGTIYGLLGASGCGKTTLLSCIVGRKSLDSGSVWVLGGNPGTEGSGIPGPRVGYMPQEIALVAEFTVKGAVEYFGRILDMSDELIEERFNSLSKLLDLPPDNRLVKNCSGGQQRRISFAAAMVHKPELLILDEPTVGLDPVLRDSIWNYFVEITQKENIAVIITTHYIEEARQAHKIGLMREGRLLAEESPERLLALFRTDTLEEVFLILSRQQEEGRLQDVESLADDQNNTVIQTTNSEVSLAMTEIGHGSTDVLTERSSEKKIKTRVGAFSLNKNRLKALMEKNSLQYFRNVAGICFTLIFPIFEILAFFLAIGGDVKDIKIGIVNDEYTAEVCSGYNRNGTTLPYNYTDCDFTDLSCRFLEDVQDPMIDKALIAVLKTLEHAFLYDNRNLFKFQIHFEDLDNAIESIKHGNIVGVLYFAHNFTESYERRLHMGTSIDNESLDLSEIKVWLDMSNRQVGATIKFKLFSKFVDFQKNLARDCNLFEKFGDVPIRFNYQHGDDKETYTVFMTPGVLLTIMFFMGATMTSTIIITDRLEGVWDRSIVAGVSSLEIMITHFFTQFILICFQVVELMVLTFVVYKTEYIGSLFLITLMVTLQGLCGMCFGFWVSVISENHNMANIVTTGSFYPMILLCGMVWPLEGQPMILRYISKCLPFTVAITSLRNVIKKGWTADNLEVFSGIGISILWIVSLSLVSIFLIKRKR